MDGEHIKPEDAIKILQEDTPRMVRRLRRELQTLKDHLRERGQSAGESRRTRKQAA